MATSFVFDAPQAGPHEARGARAECSAAQCEGLAAAPAASIKHRRRRVAHVKPPHAQPQPPNACVGHLCTCIMQ